MLSQLSYAPILPPLSQRLVYYTSKKTFCQGFSEVFLITFFIIYYPVLPVENPEKTARLFNLVYHRKIG